MRLGVEPYFVQILITKLETIKKSQLPKNESYEMINSFYQEMHNIIFENEEFDLMNQKIHFNQLTTKTKLLSIKIFRVALTQMLEIEKDPFQIEKIVGNYKKIDTLWQITLSQPIKQYNLLPSFSSA